MNDLSGYGQKGDLAAPFARTKTAERAQEEAQSRHDWVQEVVAKAPPLSPEARDEIAALLGPVADRPKLPMMRWRLRRYCGDVVEQAAVASRTDPDEAFRHEQRCPTCGMDPATIVDAEPIGISATN